VRGCDGARSCGGAAAAASGRARTRESIAIALFIVFSRTNAVVADRHGGEHELVVA